jgi:hypothetical protein
VNNKSLGLLLTVILLASTGLTAVDDGLEAYWKFNSESGNTAKDSSVNSNSGSISGASWTDGRFEEALSFDGNNDYVVADNYYGVAGTQPRTVTFWWKGTEITDHSWVKWGIDNAGEKYYVRAHEAGSECYLRVEVAGGQNYGNTNVCDGEWHMLTVVFPDGSNSVHDHNLYVDTNQQPVNGGDQSMNTDTSNKRVHVGHPLAHHAYANGKIDDVRIYDRALSENEIEQLYDYSPDFCDGRGLNNECIMNKTRELNEDRYNISSVFISEASAKLQAFSGQAHMDIDNSSMISGFWKGSFFIDTERPRLVSGARFRPGNGDIVIGS